MYTIYSHVNYNRVSSYEHKQLEARDFDVMPALNAVTVFAVGSICAAANMIFN